MWRFKSATYYLAFIMAGTAILRSGFLFFKEDLFVSALMVMATREKTHRRYK